MSLKLTKSESQRPISLYIGAFIVVVGAIVILCVLTFSKKNQIESETAHRAEVTSAGPFVRTVSPTLSSAQTSITLEGDALPYASTTLFAKIGGYLHSISVDKGDEVKQGQTLAIIESPETDQQYQAAIADAQNKAKINERNKELLVKQLISPQTAEQSATDAAIAKQTLAVDKTNKGYETITAPFSGRITGRFVDPGALIQNAVNQETTTQPLVSIARVDRLRIDVYIDQRYAAFVHVGDPVEISLPERPGFVLKAAVTRYTGELDPQTRMQLVEIEVPNLDRKIVPWSTVNVNLKVSLPAQLEIPEEALIVRKDKFFVPIVDSKDCISFREVHIGDNNGKMVEILDGLTGNEKIGLNIGNGIIEGAHVRPESDTKSS
jgi:membrane fusion protein (multidrug efflux system)